MNTKTNLDKLFKTDIQAEREGVEFTISDDCGFTVRRFNASNPQVKAAFATHFKPFARQMQMGTMDPEKEQEINMKVFVNACLVGWRGVKDENDQEIPFSKDSAVALFKRLPDLFETLTEYASNIENYREEVGNS